MRRCFAIAGLLTALVLVAAAGVSAQDRGKAKNRQLPANWGKLGLDDEQRRKIYAVQDEYAPKIADLRKQIEDLTKKEREEMAAVLRKEQKEQLKKILTERVPDSKPPEDTKKPGGQ